ncbi:MAG: hypothetical protein QOK17_299 [Sphingomonadales bacterium]|jgi:uncharacterized protein (TIGR02001 family)|nr:hypothetical protein [Sphingomonadales bacterium]
MKALLPFLAFFTAPALAEPHDEAAPPSAGAKTSVGGGVTLLSDYRFRGLSRSGGGPALQGQLNFSLPNGLYAGGRGTTLKGVRALGDAELDLYAGYGAALASGTTLDAGLTYYAFPGGAGGSDYAEPYVSLSHTLGPVEATLGAKYAWKQAALGGEDQFYLFGQLEGGIPLTPVTLTAEAGRQDAGRFGRYWNWSLGGRFAMGPLEAGLRYVDTDLRALPGRRSGAGVVASLGVRF